MRILPTIKGDKNPAKRPEVRQKIREKALGRKMTDADKLKMSLKAKESWKKGRVPHSQSLDTRKKLSQIQKGLRHSPSTEFKKGTPKELHPRWKGGISKFRDSIRNSDEYKLWRGSVFERDKYLCQMPDCNKIDRRLEAHHIKTFSEFIELRFEISNGITLCKSCHTKVNGKENKYEKLFQEIIKI